MLKLYISNNIGIDILTFCPIFSDYGGNTACNIKCFPPKWDFGNFENMRFPGGNGALELIIPTQPSSVDYEQYQCHCRQPVYRK